MDKDIKILQETFPFLTLFRYSNEEYVGIIQNQGKSVVSVYVYNNIHELAQKKRFLELAEVWWWESNRKIPINLFLKSEFSEFKAFLKNFNPKEFEIVQGHTVSLQKLNDKRLKRRRVELVKDLSNRN